MKRLVMAILMSALLVLTVPSSILAKPARTVIADLYVVATGGYRDINYETGEVIGAVSYAGVVTDAVRKSKDWKKLAGGTISAQEEVHYFIDQTGNIVWGAAAGTIIITGDQNSVLTIAFEATVSGNLFTQASDVGTWSVTSATKSLHQLKNATGAWTATVNMQTFSGTAHVEGDF